MWFTSTYSGTISHPPRAVQCAPVHPSTRTKLRMQNLDLCNVREIQRNRVILIRGQVWPRGWSPLLLRGGAQEDLAFWVGILYTCPGKGLFALRSHCSRRGAAIQPQRFKQARATDAGAASF